MIIMPHPYGRMANRLLLASSFIAHAEEQGDSFLHLAFIDYFHYFEGTKHSPFLYYRSTHPVQRHKTTLFDSVNIWNTYDKQNESYNLGMDSFLQIQFKTRFLFTIGWSFRAPDSTRKHRSILLKFFAPVKQHRETVLRHIEKAREKTDHLVGVHIRQTDYKKFANGKYFFSLDVYRRIMTSVASQLPGKTRFLLCSDAPMDPAWFAPLDAMRSTGHPVEDNYALSACDYIIGPPSTFTLWASFYGGKPIRFIKTADTDMALSLFEIQSSI